LQVEQLVERVHVRPCPSCTTHSSATLRPARRMQLCRRPNALPPTTSRRSPATCPPRQIASTSTRYARDGTPLPAADPGRRQHRLPRRVVNLQATADLPCFLMPTGYHRTSRFLPPLGRTSANAYSKASATAAITDTFPVRLLRTDGSDGLTESDASDCSVPSRAVNRRALSLNWVLQLATARSFTRLQCSTRRRQGSATTWNDRTRGCQAGSRV